MPDTADARPVVELYHDPETDEWTVITDDFDDLTTSCEQEARDEADARAAEIGGRVRVY